MAMLCAQSPQTTYGVTFLRYLMKAMPESIQRALIDPEIGPQGLLINMRPSLNEINKENENVKSFPITAFGVEVARSVPYKRKIAGATWLDLSKEIFTMYIPEKDVMIKFSYQLITRVHFATASNTMQVIYSIIVTLAHINRKYNYARGQPSLYFIKIGIEIILTILISSYFCFSSYNIL